MKRTLHAIAIATAVSALVAGVVTTQGLTANAATTATVTASTIRTASTTTVFKGGLFVQPDSSAAIAAASLSAQGQTADAAAAATIAKQPVAIWLGDWLTGQALTDIVTKNVAEAEAKGTTPVFVTYAIPNRDCGGYSAGGLTNDTYLAWNQTIATALKGHRAVVLVEPDSIGDLTNCDAATAATRLPLLKSAVQQFSAAGVPSYLDGGNSNWNSAALQASRLNQAGISSARGFFTNVSNFYTVGPERAYASAVSALTGGSHYVIDVSRNGNGSNGQWCNPTGSALGQTPHATYGTTGLDALLWVKTPGESDGTCNGGPSAGAWFASYADALVANAKH